MPVEIGPSLTRFVWLVVRVITVAVSERIIKVPLFEVVPATTTFVPAKKPSVIKEPDEAVIVRPAWAKVRVRPALPVAWAT